MGVSNHTDMKYRGPVCLHEKVVNGLNYEVGAKVIDEGVGSIHCMHNFALS